MLSDGADVAGAQAALVSALAGWASAAAGSSADGQDDVLTFCVAGPVRPGEL
jgi:hypothetical protein